ncbi:quinolinate synthetase complex, A subunit [Thermoplasmatales archaeon BRNA1]|nr:quinolinate synthetase complex, A subunit [Thermoplasmatales archaeon BRNA1]
MQTVQERIAALKKEKNAVILAHNYTSPEVQDLADYVGDSLGLSKKAAATDADIIVFAGVSFMGETAKILSPAKKVLLPEPEAKCAMAAMCSPEQIRQVRAQHPGAVVVGYVNTDAATKTEMDYCCTSSNALNVVKAIGSDDIIFVPDVNLGRYVREKSGKNVVLWNGFCPVHQCVTVRQVEELKAQHPGAVVAAHPECRLDVLNMSDYIGSTENILNYCRESPAQEFIILTEMGMGHRLERACPGKKFYFTNQSLCMTMKMISPESVLECLEKETGEIVLPDDVAEKAYVPVNRMTDILG